MEKNKYRNITYSIIYCTKICPTENEDTKNIYLAQLGECHYIPLDVIESENLPKCLQYNDSHNEFIEWGEKILTLYYNEDKESDSKDENNKEYLNNKNYKNDNSNYY